MAHEEQLHGGAAGGVSRRKVIVTGAAMAAAGVAVGAGGALLVSDNASASGGGVAQPGEPVMVHLKDAQSGQLDLFVGERRLSFNDRALAARLAQASNDAV